MKKPTVTNTARIVKIVPHAQLSIATGGRGTLDGKTLQITSCEPGHLRVSGGNVTAEKAE